MSCSCSTSVRPGACSELVWEVNGLCTVQAGDERLPAGIPGAWSPDVLIASGVAASIMTAFMAACARRGLGVLAYASQQRVRLCPKDPMPHVVVAPCVTVRTDAEAAMARALLEQAVAEAPGPALLSAPVRLEPRVVALPEEPLDREC